MKTHQKPCYEPVKDCTYWTVLGSLKNWNIVKFSNWETSGEYIDNINQVVHVDISDTMAVLVQTGKYGDIITTDTTTMGYYVIELFL